MALVLQLAAMIAMSHFFNLRPPRRQLLAAYPMSPWWHCATWMEICTCSSRRVLKIMKWQVWRGYLVQLLRLVSVVVVWTMVLLAAVGLMAPLSQHLLMAKARIMPQISANIPRHFFFYDSAVFCTDWPFLGRASHAGNRSYLDSVSEMDD